MKRAVLQQLQEARRHKRPVALVTDLDNGGEALIDNGEVVAGALVLSAPQLQGIEAAIRHDRGGRLPAPDESLFVEVFNPPLRLIIVGAVHIAQALGPMARIAGYEVTVVDPRRAFASDSRFPELPVRHDWPDDALRELAPDRRTAVITLTHDPKLDDPALQVALESDAQLQRIHGPLGLPLGGRAPAEIAIAALAQMTQVLHGAPPLEKRPQPARAAG